MQLQYLNCIHDKMIQYYIEKIKKLKNNEHIELWVSSDYDSDFPKLKNNFDYDQECELSCYCILITKIDSYLIPELVDEFEYPEYYLKHGINPSEIKSINECLLPEIKLDLIKTSLILDILLNLEQTRKIDNQIIKPRKLLFQFNIPNKIIQSIIKNHEIKY